MGEKKAGWHHWSQFLFCLGLLCQITDSGKDAENTVPPKVGGSIGNGFIRGQRTKKDIEAQ